MFIHDKHLFPLNLVNKLLDGYYMDSEFNIFSTRLRKGQLYKMHGSSGNRFGWNNAPIEKRYFTMANTSWSHQYLKNAACIHADFHKHVSGVEEMRQEKITMESLGVKQSEDYRLHATTLDSGIKNKGWIIGTYKNGMLIFNSCPAVHLNEASMKLEMERLAKSSPGTKFVSAKIDGTALAGGVTWE